MTEESAPEREELTLAEKLLLERRPEVRGYVPQVVVPEPATAPAGRAGASPGADASDVAQTEGSGEESQPPVG